MTLEDVLIDLEEAGLMVLSVHTYKPIHDADYRSETYYTFEGDLHLKVQEDLKHKLRFWVGCHKKDGAIVGIFVWPDNDDGVTDFGVGLDLEGSNAGSMIVEERWPKLLKCLRRMLT